VNKTPSNETVLAEYLATIPVELHALLVPADEQGRSELTDKVKKLAVREEERNYVLELQHQYGVPIRPNESVKRTMIRVRLKLLKALHAAGIDEDMGEPGSMPTDPLE